jgi:hypothetical protein
MIRGTLDRFDVEFDVWQSERDLHTSGEVDATLETLDRQVSSTDATTPFGCVRRRCGGTKRIAWWSSRMVCPRICWPTSRITAENSHAASISFATFGAPTITDTFPACELASDFQSYYTRLQKVHGDSILPQQRQCVGDWHATWDWRKAAARLAWVAAIRQVLEIALSLLGVSAPQEMKRADAAEDPAASDES